MDTTCICELGQARPQAKCLDKQRTTDVSHLAIQSPLALCYKFPQQRWRAPSILHSLGTTECETCQCWQRVDVMRALQ